MNAEPHYGARNKLGLILAPVILILFLSTSPPDGLSEAGWRTAGVGILMATLWITEAIALPATAMLPLVLFPLLGISDVGKAAGPYAHKIIFLMLGGFLLALAMQQWGLHKRYALHILKKVGTSPNRIVAGSMIATSFLSMWVSNTATTLMMLPIAMSIIYLLEDSFKKQEGMSNKDIANFSLWFWRKETRTSWSSGILTSMQSSKKIFRVVVRPLISLKSGLISLPVR